MVLRAPLFKRRPNGRLDVDLVGGSHTLLQQRISVHNSRLGEYAEKIPVFLFDLGLRFRALNAEEGGEEHRLGVKIG